MEIIRFSILVILFSLFGYTYVKFLTVHPLKMSRFLLIAVLAFTTGITWLATSFAGIALGIGSLCALACAAAAYSLAARRVLARKDSHPVPD